MHVESPRARGDFNGSRKVLSLWSLVACFKNIFALWFHAHFLMILYLYIAPARSDNPLGPKYWCQQKDLITLVICYKFSSTSDFIHLINVYSHRPWGRQPPRGQNFDVNRNILSLQSFVTSFQKISLNLILYTFFMILYMYISPIWGRGRQPIGDKISMSTETPYHFTHLLQV